MNRFHALWLQRAREFLFTREGHTRWTICAVYTGLIVVLSLFPLRHLGLFAPLFPHPAQSIHIVMYGLYAFLLAGLLPAETRTRWLILAALAFWVALLSDMVDKLLHFFLYGLYAAAIAWALPPRYGRWWIVLSGVVSFCGLFGCGMEVLQGRAVRGGRSVSPGDALANTIGALAFTFLAVRSRVASYRYVSRVLGVWLRRHARPRWRRLRLLPALALGRK